MFTLLRRYWFIVLFFMLAACRAAEAPPPTVADTAVPPATVTPVPTAGAVATVVPTAPVVQVTAPAEATPDGIAELALPAGGVVLHPVPVIYAGDRVTFQITADVPDAISPEQVRVDITVDGRRVAAGPLGYRGFSGRAIGVFEWAWDTTDAAGQRQLQVTLDPDDQIQVGDADQADNVQVLTVVVRPAAALSAHERQAQWVTVEREMARIHVVSGSAAQRDLDLLVLAVDAGMRRATDRLEVRPVDKVDFYFIERVMGQGGYANSVVVISYLDRNYSGGGLEEVVTHEAVHMLERQFAPDRFAFLSEGIAVWASGGHYQQEDLAERSAALLTLDQYVPLADLLDTFYLQQHEVAYLEAAGFVNYLVGRYGWVPVRAFYSSLRFSPDESPSAGVDRHLRARFGRGLAELEASWLAEMAAEPVSAAMIADLRTNIRFFDLMRRYQQSYDPTAYFLDAWLPFPDEATAHGLGLTADFMRHPRSETNIILETMLIAADQAWRSDNDDQANVLLDSVERVLNRGGVIIDPLAGAYQQLVETAEEMGYEAQQITITLSQAFVLVRRPDGRQLLLLKFTRDGQEWVPLG